MRTITDTLGSARRPHPSAGDENGPRIAIACGGTGGHLFPGLAVANVLQEWGCELALMVSSKEVDQEAVKSAIAMKVVPLPAVALQNRQWSPFLRGAWDSYRLCRKVFQEFRPRAVLAMGGFTSAPPVLAGKRLGAFTFLHESNSIPGRANRWLAPWVDEVFVGFPTAARRLSTQCIRYVGTPVRSQFKPVDPGPCRMALGLSAKDPVLLIMGGSQGASGINQLLLRALPVLAQAAPHLQFLHITGHDECPQVQAAYAAQGRRAAVRPFLTEMDLALGAATLAVNRAGASSLAELAAMRVPAILVPYPYATDDHQFHNARALVRNGAARLITQATATPEGLTQLIVELLEHSEIRTAMQSSLQQWHFPNAARDIAGHIFSRLGLSKPAPPLPEEEEASAQPLPMPSFRPWKPVRSQVAVPAET